LLKKLVANRGWGRAEVDARADDVEAAGEVGFFEFFGEIDVVDLLGSVGDLPASEGAGLLAEVPENGGDFGVTRDERDEARLVSSDESAGAGDPALEGGMREVVLMAFSSYIGLCVRKMKIRLVIGSRISQIWSLNKQR
jgi:hypothetical protein